MDALGFNDDDLFEPVGVAEDPILAIEAPMVARVHGTNRTLVLWGLWLGHVGTLRRRGRGRMCALPCGPIRSADDADDDVIPG